MSKNIGIIPSVIKRRKAISLTIDNNLIVFLKKCFPKSNIQILGDIKKKNKLNLIVSSGGNTIVSLNKNVVNQFRRKLDEYYFKQALKKNIPFLGICHGAQYVADYYKSKIIKKKNHTNKNHLIKLDTNKRIIVNSYHDFSIIELGKDLKKIALTSDLSIEAFKHNKKKILGIMWHPERYKKIKKFDLNFIKKYL
jgi:gamma-glutamyl-gamma-aminobutyrate hydrolase PuuD